MAHRPTRLAWRLIPFEGEDDTPTLAVVGLVVWSVG